MDRMNLDTSTAVSAIPRKPYIAASFVELMGKETANEAGSRNDFCGQSGNNLICSAGP
ncbi:MAG: hypothetical protein NTX73_10980 [Rhodobacterales bacterium]|nr:hypothetical protein [Rhodobacterales bacterium]